MRLMMLVLMVVLTLGACGGASDQDAAGVEIGAGDTPVASYEKREPWGTGDDAALEGVLTLEGDCLLVVADDGTHVVAAFPSHFVWDDDTQTLTGEGFSAAVGDRVTLGGGGGGPATHFPFVTLPLQCRDDSVFVAQSGE